MAGGTPAARCSICPSGVKEEPTSRSKVRTGESRNTYAPLPAREAKMPAWGQVGGGGVVVKGPSVMGGTRRRSARENHVQTQKEINGREKVDAGNRNRNRPRRKSNRRRANHKVSAGKRNAGKLARSVWKGGKAARPYLSLLLESELTPQASQGQFGAVTHNAVHNVFLTLPAYASSRVLEAPQSGR
jgi:hypothetical protein